MYPFRGLGRRKAVLVGMARAGFGTSSVITPWAVGQHQPGRHVPNGFTGRASRLNNRHMCTLPCPSQSIECGADIGECGSRPSSKGYSVDRKNDVSVLERVRVGEKGKTGGRRGPGYRFLGWYGAVASRGRLFLLCNCRCACDCWLHRHDWMLEIAEVYSDGTLSIGHGCLAAFVTAVMCCRLRHSRRKFLCCRV